MPANRKIKINGLCLTEDKRFPIIAYCWSSLDIRNDAASLRHALWVGLYDFEPASIDFYHQWYSRREVDRHAIRTT